MRCSINHMATSSSRQGALVEQSVPTSASEGLQSLLVQGAVQSSVWPALWHPWLLRDTPHCVSGPTVRFSRLLRGSPCSTQH